MTRHHMRRGALGVLALAAVALAPGGAQAAVIQGLFNSGTDANNLALVGNGQIDTHWTIVDSDAPGFAGQQARTFYGAPYAPNDANSGWISLSGTGQPANSISTYRLTFDLTGLDYLTAQITGSWGVDNQGSIRLNGMETGYALVDQMFEHFESLHGFSLTGGFVAGINTLDFHVIDNGVVTALRVDDLQGTAGAAAAGVPEPSAWALMILGFGAAGAVLRRRRLAVTL